MKTKKQEEIKRRFEEIEWDLNRAFDSSSGKKWHYDFFRRFKKLKRMCLE